MIYLSTAIGLTPGDSGTAHIYMQIIHRTTKIQTIHRTTQITTNLEDCGPCPIFASFTPAFALQLRKKHGKASIYKIKSFFRTNIILVCTFIFLSTDLYSLITIRQMELSSLTTVDVRIWLSQISLFTHIINWPETELCRLS